MSSQLPEKHVQNATRISFLIAGLATAAWAPLVPYAKNRLNLDEHTLGMLLLCLGAGSIISMPLAGILTARFGCRRLIIISSLMLCLVLPWLALAPTLWGMVAGLLFFGVSIGILDVVINVQAIIVERDSGKKMMSGFHGLFSLGGILGASGLALALWSGLSSVKATLIVCVIILALLIIYGRHLLPNAVEQQGPIFVLPHGSIILIGALCFISFLAEGAMLDWSAVFLTSNRGLDTSYGGLGYAAFAAAMTLGRLTGDFFVRAFGGVVILAFGGLCAACGFITAVIFPHPAAAFLGFALVGLGASNIVPVLYSATGRQRIMPANLAVAAVTMIGYSGILTGPAAIGFIAHATSLPTALLFIAALLVLLSMSCRIAK